jgi:hypothetical protein
MILGGILLATFTAGCFGGRGGYSNQPYDYRGGSFGSDRHDNGYGNPYPYNGGYNDTHSYPQSFGHSNAYTNGLHDRLRAAASRDRHADHAATEPQVAVAPEREHMRAKREPSSIDSASARH